MKHLIKKLEFKSCIRVTILTVLMSSFMINPAHAQRVKLSGMVISDTNSEPLIGVNVVVEGTQAGTITDFNGTYTIDVSKGETLVFSYVGFLTKKVKYNGRKTLDVRLSEDAKLIDEVVVVGYGTMKRSDLTGAVSSVTGDELKRTQATTLDQILQGRVSGVQVTQNSSAPGGGISVSIRGTNSFNGNEPLYVIDGVPIRGQATDNTNALSSINPSDIVSMEVLKDASATAIYGSRASNGVIMITTRRGEAGKTRVTYEGSFGVQTLPERLDVMNLTDFAKYRNRRAEVLGYGEIYEFKDVSLLGEGTNWQDEIIRNAPMHNHQLSISGGNDYGKYSVSLGYLDQDGIAIASGFRRITGRVNLDSKITNWFNVGVSATLGSRKQTNTIDNGGIIWTSLDMWPSIPVKNSDGSYGILPEAEGVYQPLYLNPVGDALNRENYNRETNFYGNVWGEITFLKDFRFRVEYGGGFNHYTRYWYNPTYDYGTWTQTAESQRQANNGSNYYFKQQLDYGQWRPNYNFNIMIAHEANENFYENLEASRINYLQNSVHELAAGDPQTAKNNSSRDSGSMESYLGRFNFNLLDKYLLTATLRADGSSRFGSSNRWGWFPSFALAWKVNREKFLSHVKWLDNLKLRLGWGLVGNQWIPSYSYGVSMNSSGTIWGTGYYEGNYANSDLKWERTKSYNIGLDFAALNNRIEFILEYYYKDTDNLLMCASLPDYITGNVTAPYVNVGALTNKGIEITLNTVNISKPHFTWKTSLMFSLNRNKVTKLYTSSSSIIGELKDGENTVTTKSIEGEPIGQFYGYEVLGIFQNEKDFYQLDSNGDYVLDANGNRIQVAIPEGKSIKEEEIWIGDYKFKDINGDGKINADDRTFIGNPEPKFTFGISNTFRYRDFDLNIFLNGVVGNKIYNYVRQRWCNPMANNNMLAEVNNLAVVQLIDPNGGHTLDNMYVSNPAATICRLTPNNANSNNRMSDKFVEDGSYLRIKNISLGYTFPKKIIKKWNIENFRLYVNVQNLLTITGYDGYDPEIGAYNYDVTLKGIDWVRYPSQHIYTIGANITF